MTPPSIEEPILPISQIDVGIGWGTLGAHGHALGLTVVYHQIETCYFLCKVVTDWFQQAALPKDHLLYCQYKKSHKYSKQDTVGAGIKVDAFCINYRLLMTYSFSHSALFTIFCDFFILTSG